MTILNGFEDDIGLPYDRSVFLKLKEMICSEDSLPLYQYDEYDKENTFMVCIERIDLIISVLLCFRKQLAFSDIVDICLKLLYQFTDTLVFKQIKTHPGKCARKVINLKLELCCNFLINYIAVNFREIYNEQKKISKKVYFDTIEASVEECLEFFSEKLGKVANKITFSQRDLRNLFETFEDINNSARLSFTPGANYQKSFMEKNFEKFMPSHDLTLMDFKMILKRASSVILGNTSPSLELGKKKPSKVKNELKQTKQTSSANIISGEEYLPEPVEAPER